MGLHYENLDDETRRLMVAEIDLGPLYESPRLSAFGLQQWPILLRDAASSHDDDWLAHALRSPGVFQRREQYVRNAKTYWRDINLQNAAQMLAEGEFNRFYLRALCLRAPELGITHLEVYRGKQVLNPRPESETKLGSLVETIPLLEYLRSHDFVSVDRAFAIPSGPNSGLTARLFRR